MPLLLRLIPAIPPELLFTYGPRLQQKGFRWAPQTFLAPFGLQEHMNLRMHTEYREVASLDLLQVPKTYLHDLGYAIFLPSVQFQPNIETIPTVFSLLVPDSGEWYHISIQDTAANPLSLLIQPDNLSKTFALLLTNLDYCNLGLMVETTGKTNDDKMLGTWMFIVEIHEMKEGDKTHWAEIAKQHRFKGDSTPFTWWIVD
jgi:hypothetical protein